jgi:hypothetical protein
MIKDLPAPSRPATRRLRVTPARRAILALGVPVTIALIGAAWLQHRGRGRHGQLSGRCLEYHHISRSTTRCLEYHHPPVDLTLAGAGIKLPA